MRYTRAVFLGTGAVVLFGLILLLVSLALPVKVWRTGELTTEPLKTLPAESFAASPVRIWIDTDAACGQNQRTDPDDCFAILLLSRQEMIEIAGMSTVFGNAPLHETYRTTRNLIHLLGKDRLHAIPVYRGASEALKQEDSIPTGSLQEAHEALRKALEEGPLVIVALGPLTNIAMALEDRPDLQVNVTQLIAVMGRRKGHVFHPVEGGTAHSFLGHGPIFRDFNVTKDERAAAVVMAMGLPLTLVPYEAARNVLLDRTTLNRMERLDGPAAWIAQRAHPWVTYWRKDIGIAGFYPFDLVAAAYVVHPSLLRCTKVSSAIEDDTWLFGWLGYRGVFVEPAHETEAKSLRSGTAQYCPEVSKQLERWLVEQLTSASSSS